MGLDKEALEYEEIAEKTRRGKDKNLDRQSVNLISGIWLKRKLGFKSPLFAIFLNNSTIIDNIEKKG